MNISAPRSLVTAMGAPRMISSIKEKLTICLLYHSGVIPTSSRPGKFITFEGLDGSGKSTQLGKCADVLMSRGWRIVVTREPGGTETGEKIRQLLLNSGSSGINPHTELALMFAARTQHIQQIILPCLAEGSIVLCDRFTDSTEAYQGAGRQLGAPLVLELHRLLCGGLQPDLTILLDSEVSKSILRARRRNHSAASRDASEASTDENRFEMESTAFFERVHTAYLQIAAREPARVKLIDARGAVENTHQRIIQLMGMLLPQVPGDSRGGDALI